MRIIKLIICLSIVLLSVACQSQVKQNFDFHQDFAFLVDVLIENSSYLNQESAATLKDDYESKIDQITNLEQFFIFCNLFLKNYDQGHLAILSPAQLSYVSSQYGHLANVHTFFMNHPNKSILDNDEINSAYLELNDYLKESTFRIDNTNKVIEANNIKLELIDKTAIITIKSFMQMYIEGDLRLIEEFLDSNIIDVIIFDIRSNPGGSTEYWHQLVEMTSNESYTYNLKAPYKNKGELAQAYVDYYRQNDRIDIIDDVVYSTNMIMEGTNISNEYKIFLFVNENTKSAGELFLDFCNKSGYATTIGTKTANSLGIIEPMLVRLPSTSLVLQLDVLKLTDEFTAQYQVNNSKNKNNYFKIVEQIIIE